MRQWDAKSKKMRGTAEMHQWGHIQTETCREISVSPSLRSRGELTGMNVGSLMMLTSWC